MVSLSRLTSRTTGESKAKWIAAANTKGEALKVSEQAMSEKQSTLRMPCGILTQRQVCVALSAQRGEDEPVGRPGTSKPAL
jgi:hypothetical protein